MSYREDQSFVHRDKCESHDVNNTELQAKEPQKDLSRSDGPDNPIRGSPATKRPLQPPPNPLRSSGDDETPKASIGRRDKRHPGSGESKKRECPRNAIEMSQAEDSIDWKKMGQFLLKIIRSFCRSLNEQDREDICQNVLLIVYVFSIDHHTHNFYGLIKNILKKQIADHFRRKRRQCRDNHRTESLPDDLREKERRLAFGLDAYEVRDYLNIILPLMEKRDQVKLAKRFSLCCDDETDSGAWDEDFSDDERPTRSALGHLRKLWLDSYGHPLGEYE